jgi:Tol biopolymer transport system component
VYVADPDGGVPKRLSTAVNNDSIPSWSRDGKSIYVTAGGPQFFDILKIPVEGGAPKFLIRGTFVGNVTESVDGKWLYFAKGDADSEIRAVPAAGGEDRELTGMPKNQEYDGLGAGEGRDLFSGPENHAGNRQIIRCEHQADT